MVKGKKRGNTKPPSPCRQNWMLCSLNHRHDITVHENTKLNPSLLPFEELIMNNSDLSTKSKYDNCSNINFPLHHAFKQVNLKFRNVGKPLYGVFADPNSNNGLKSPRHLLYKSKDKNKYPLMNTSTSIPIVGWKITKKQSHIISDISIPGRLPHCGFSHRFELNTDLPSMSDKDKRLLYSLIERLLFIREITVPDVHACVSYIITRMELITFCHKNGHLQVDLLSVKNYDCSYCHLQKNIAYIWNHCF